MRFSIPGHSPILLLCLFLALGGVAPSAFAQDAAPGKALFLAACGVCHAVEPGATARQGPNLAGIYGRAAGTVAEFKYSEALKVGGWAWDEATLDPWLENPQAAHPGTTMLYRQRDADKRKLLVGYLKTLAKAP